MTIGQIIKLKSCGKHIVFAKVLLKGSYGVSLDVATLAIICDLVVDGDVYNTLFEKILGIVAEEGTYLSNVEPV
jgi:hypothetical protein